MSVMFTVGGEDVGPIMERIKRHDLYLPVRERHFPSSPFAEQIIRQVAYDHRISVEHMRSDQRWRVVAYARFDAFTRLRAVIRPNGKHRFSLPHIGWLLGGRDHSTVSNGLKRWAKIQTAKREAEAA